MRRMISQLVLALVLVSLSQLSMQIGKVKYFFGQLFLPKSRNGIPMDCQSIEVTRSIREGTNCQGYVSEND